MKTLLYAITLTSALLLSQVSQARTIFGATTIYSYSGAMSDWQQAAGSIGDGVDLERRGDMVGAYREYQNAFRGFYRANEFFSSASGRQREAQTTLNGMTASHSAMQRALEAINNNRSK